MATSLEEAFDLEFPEAIEAQDFYVTLMMRTQRYGGPEEGGWWVDDTHIIKYVRFATEEQARAAMLRVEAKAAELTAEARATHGRHCVNQLRWLEDRNLDSDHLSELDGPAGYYVVLGQGLPTEERGPTSYE